MIRDSKCGPLVSEATALPTEPRPLPKSNLQLLYRNVYRSFSDKNGDFLPPNIRLIREMYTQLRRTGQMEDANKLRNLTLADHKISKEDKKWGKLINPACEATLKGSPMLSDHYSCNNMQASNIEFISCNMKKPLANLINILR